MNSFIFGGVGKPYLYSLEAESVTASSTPLAPKVQHAPVNSQLPICISLPKSCFVHGNWQEVEVKLTPCDDLTTQSIGSLTFLQEAEPNSLPSEYRLVIMIPK